MNNNKLAFLYMMISTVSFSLMGLFVRFSGDLPVYEKVFFRNLVLFIIITITMIKSGNISFVGKKENRKLLILRSVFGLLGVYFFFFAIDNLCLSDSNVLSKTSTFFVSIFSMIILKDKIAKNTLIMMILGFIGAVLIIKPQFDYSVLPAVSGVTSAMFAGLAYTIISKINKREKGETIIFYFSAISIIGTLPLFLYDFVMPTPTQFINLLMVGIFAAGGQYFLSFAYRVGNAPKTSIVNFVGVVVSLLLGVIFFNEIPDVLSIIGTAVIIFSVFWLYKSKK